MSAERIFADTNIWFYAFVRGQNPEDERKNDVAAQLIGCTMLYSEDMQHDQMIEQSLRIHNPFL